MAKKKTITQQVKLKQANKMAGPSAKWNTPFEREAYITGVMDGMELHANGIIVNEGPPKKTIKKMQKQKKTVRKTKK